MTEDEQFDATVAAFKERLARYDALNPPVPEWYNQKPAEEVALKQAASNLVSWLRTNASPVEFTPERYAVFSRLCAAVERALAIPPAPSTALLPGTVQLLLRPSEAKEFAHALSDHLCWLQGWEAATKRNRKNGPQFTDTVRACHRKLNASILTAENRQR